MAAACACARRTSISSEINVLLRLAIATSAGGGAAAPVISPEGRRNFPVSHGLRPVTSEKVARLEDEGDIRHLDA